MKKSIRNEINRANAQKSTGPTTEPGKQRSSMNAMKHGLTGNHLLLQEHERESFQRLTSRLLKELEPGSEMERQLVQKIIDCHTRLNRIAALEGNILNLGLIENETSADHDDATDSIVAQARSWIENADSFEKLGRYEARISRQLLQYTKEFERLRNIREHWESMQRFTAARDAAKARKDAEAAETEPLNSESASFRKTDPEPRPIDSKPPKSNPPNQRAA